MASWFEVSGFGFQEFSAGGVRTFAVVEGQQSAFPFVLLHGLPGASFVWSTTIAAIGRSRRIISPDLPGWGRSFDRMTPQRMSLTREKLFAWLADVIRAQQIEHFDLCGFQDGGWLALEFLRQQPDRVRRIGLINLPLKTQPERSIFGIRRKADWTRTRLADWLTRDSGLGQETLEQVRPMFEELLSGGWHPDGSPEFPRGEFLAEVAGYKQALREYKGETLLAWGDASAEYDAESVAAFAHGRSVHVFPGAGNFPMWDDPGQFHEVLVDFFRS
ncbi:MAG: alpha/beta hydrolase [Calditrichaeota bacterium]|nr:alpha/beta hydrolase [Calditrichota bacterium]MCB9365622.1 alpha/beta hydrolase [Calditrichota bacterium]